MTLSELLKGFNFTSDLDIKGVTNDSKEVKPGYLFVAVKGTKTDGGLFIEDAINRGAIAIVSEQDFPKKNGTVFIKVNSVNDVLWQIAKQFYGDPSLRLKMTGITGTNGKTTTAYLVKNIFQCAGIQSGLLGTIEYLIGDRKIPASLTTPDVLKVNQYLSQMIENKCRACVMEVSSHAAEQGRVKGVNFNACVYTNLGRDHLDYHKTIDNYLSAKTKLFTELSEDNWAVVNVDDPYADNIIKNTRAKVIGYGINAVNATNTAFKLKARGAKITGSGMKFTIDASGFDKRFSIETKLIGNYNIYNILAAAGVALAFGISEDSIREGIFITDTVTGRLEKVNAGQFFNVFVDFAHTPDAMENVIDTIKHITKGKLILVFGCGGDRDKEKRPLMGRVACRMADYTFITSDNSRSEDPIQIISDIEKGFNNKSYKAVVDRKEAIKEALALAEPGDSVLIAGKGHENYQIFKNTVIPFSDRDVAEAILKSYAGSIC
jgi:UDP-N-acetylmuramoyl-L-alanyl-D-glutamate--2,6-diaminopimelate ligase